MIALPRTLIEVAPADERPLTINIVKAYDPYVLDLEVIEDPSAATVALEPVRSRLLSELAEPASAATLAARLGIARQKATYHLKALESHRLVKESGQRKWGGITERLYVASAATYVVAPNAMGAVASDPRKNVDRLSASYLIALAARVVQEVSDLVRRARVAEKGLATLSIDAEIRFRSAEERAAFTKDLTHAVQLLAARYHDVSAPGGRAHRLVVVAHPLPNDKESS